MDVLAMHYNDFYNRGEEPMVSMPNTPCIIEGDEQGLKRIFSNIIFNTVTHGEGNYHFEIKEEAGYTFLFSNRSEPITSEELNCIFERFYTKDKSRNKKTTGLGLAITKEIVKQFGGKIEADYHNERFAIVITFPKSKTIKMR